MFMFDINYPAFWIMTGIVVVPAFIVGVVSYLFKSAEKRDGRR